MISTRAAAIAWTLFLGTVAATPQESPDTYAGPRFLSGKTPEQPPLAAAGGLTVLEIEIAASGIVTNAIAIDEAPPFTEVLQEATRLWRYRPAEDDGSPIRSKALVVGVFRPPVLMGSALPEPKSLRPPSDDVPYPTTTAVPEYPPNALYEGVAVVEVAIDATGAVSEARMLSPEAGYDQPSLDAATAFRFRPARHDGRAVESYALIFFGFRQPLMSPRIPRR